MCGHAAEACQPGNDHTAPRRRTGNPQRACVQETVDVCGTTQRVQDTLRAAEGGVRSTTRRVQVEEGAGHAACMRLPGTERNAVSAARKRSRRMCHARVGIACAQPHSRQILLCALRSAPRLHGWAVLAALVEPHRNTPVLGVSRRVSLSTPSSGRGTSRRTHSNSTASLAVRLLLGLRPRFTNWPGALFTSVHGSKCCPFPAAPWRRCAAGPDDTAHLARICPHTPTCTTPFVRTENRRNATQP